jgi:pyruvoyl-dependent arginine decarboxylase (PvlArgDC)
LLACNDPPPGAAAGNLRRFFHTTPEQGFLTMNTAIQQIEAALGLAKCSDRNVTGYVVEQTGNTYRIYDDYHSETFYDLPAALAYAAELAAEAVEALSN